MLYHSRSSFRSFPKWLKRILTNRFLLPAGMIILLIILGVTQFEITFWRYTFWLIVWSMFTFLAFGVDKELAKDPEHKWRVLEIVLKQMTFFGGAFGAFFGALVFRHKLRILGVKIVILLSLIIQFGIGIYIFNYGWTGWANWTGFQGKTLWDWAELLIVPIVLALGALWFNLTEKKFEYAVEEERQQEATLQYVLERITELMLDRSLEKSKSNDMVRSVARIWILTALNRLNGYRKGVLLKFLYESDLLPSGHPIINLERANLNEINLYGADLRGIHLEGVSLQGADLSESNLSNANFKGATLINVTLFDTVLNGANLQNAFLWPRGHQGNVWLENASLQGANLKFVSTSNVNLAKSVYNVSTEWPQDFDPSTAGAILIEE